MDRYLITGASRGIGRAIARQLAGPETELLLHGRDQEALVEVFSEVESAGSKAVILTFDLADPEAVDALARKVADAPLKGLINNAGVAVVKPFDELTLTEWRQTLAVNVTAPFLLVQKLTRNMAAGSSIVNIMSVAAKRGFPNWSSYCMSKFALEGFTQCVREELRLDGIRVINIYPAATATEIWDSIEGDWPRDQMLDPERTAEAVLYALRQPDSVLIEDITVTGMGGDL
jgi:3-oxoacyl-[acyl-carrier protein] reductase